MEDAQDAWFTSDQRSTNGDNSAEVDGPANDATLTLATPIDLSGYESAELRFDWLIENGFDRKEFLAVEVSTDNSSTWSTLAQLNGKNGGGNVEDVWHTEHLDLTGYISENTLIRFRATVSGDDEDANVDNVRIVASGVATPAPSAGTIYVWDVQDTFYSRTRGPHGTEYRLRLYVRQDSDGDGMAEASDAAIGGVEVTVVFTDSLGGSQTLTGTTNNNGVFRSDWLQLAPDSYRAEVTALALDGFQWDPFGLLDPTSNDEDYDGDGLPDELLTV